MAAEDGLDTRPLRRFFLFVVKAQQAVDFVLVKDAGGFPARRGAGDLPALRIDARLGVAAAGNHGLPFGGQFVLVVVVWRGSSVFFFSAALGGFPFGG